MQRLLQDHENERDNENDCDGLLEENVYYDSDYSGNSEFEYIFFLLFIAFNHVQIITYLSMLRHL